METTAHFGRARFGRRAAIVAAQLSAVGLLFLLIADRGMAQLRFRADSTHAQQWKRVYGQLPSVWKAAQLVYVREVSDLDMDRLVERFEGPNSRTDSVVDGCYQANQDPEDIAGKITLRESLKGENAILVFVHEYGHYVWANILNGGDRTRYRQIWRAQRRAGSLVTDYAADSDEEGFAEAFSYFIRQPRTLRRLDSRSSKFLETLQTELADSGLADQEPPQ